MCKKKKPDKNKASTGCVRETPQIKISKKGRTGCVKETPQIKMKPAWGV